MDSFDPIEPHGILHGIQPRSVLRGLLWDIGLSTVFGLLLAHYLVPNGLSGSSESELDAVFASGEFNLLFLPIGLGCTAFGAYRAAIRCAGAEAANALAVGVTSLLLSLVGFLLPSLSGYPPLWIVVANFVLILPAAAAGGAFASAKQSAAA